jgi:thiamine biosynthesis lipoprotein ApbE
MVIVSLFLKNHKIYKSNDKTEISYSIDSDMIQPNTHNIITALVSLADCILSNGLATTFIVKGVERSTEFLNNRQPLSIIKIFITTDESGKCYMK